MKDTIPINLEEPKYIGSTCQGDNPVLCINEVTKDDEAVYTIEAENEFGKDVVVVKSWRSLEVN